MPSNQNCSDLSKELDQKKKFLSKINVPNNRVAIGIDELNVSNIHTFKTNLYIGVSRFRGFIL